MPDESVGKAAVSGLGILRRGRTDPFRGPWKHPALKTRLDLAFRGGRGYFTGGSERENGNSCAGINRHEVENARVSRERASDPLGPEFCVGHREVHGEA